jgi:formate dehydrogenase subunit gamma
VNGNGNGWSAQRTRSIAAAHRHQRGALLPILHALMEEYGYVDQQAIPVLADELNLSQAEVYGVVTFYRDFRTTPPGPVCVSICRAEACQAVGADALLAHATSRLGVRPGETTTDGTVSLSEVFCLGNCALGPSVMINGRLSGMVDHDRFDALVSSSAGSS